MLAERWGEVKQILSAALDLDPKQRAAYLQTACSGDPSLLEEVQSLLDAYAEGEALLEPTTSKPALSSGTHLGNYKIEALIGAGGMGEVYRATDVTLGRAVAIKVLPPSMSSDPVRLIRLEQEARAAAALNHPNILYVHRLDNHEGKLYIVSELLEGQTLRERMVQSRLTMRESIEYAIQAASGTAAAHSEGIIHRDIKPENLFITKFGQIKVLDFGLAKALEKRLRGSDALQLTQPGSMLGTVAYMSPEQVRGQEIGTESDVFSLGVVVYEMATGARPFQGETPAVVYEAVLNRTPAAPRTLNPEIDPALEQIILRAMQKDPKERFKDAAELLEGLRNLPQRSGTGSNWRTDSTSVRSASATAPRDPKRWTIPALTVIALVGIIMGARWIQSRKSSPAATGKDSIVLADFSNTTGEPVFDDALKQGLAVDLQQSPFLSILPDERISQQLKHMGRPADDRLTPEIAREVCVREGSDAVLDGSISSLGTHYVVTLKAVNCQNSSVLDEEQGEVDRREKVLAQLHELGKRVRGKLGESLASIQLHQASLEQATTPSLEALQAYSIALRTFRSRGEIAALPFFKRALELDPNFAQANADLSSLYTYLNEYSLATQYATKAYQLRDKVSDWERYSIDSTYYRTTGQLEKQAQTLEAWKETYPRTLSPYINLGIVDSYLGRLDQALVEDQQGLALNRSVGSVYADLAEDYMSLNRLDEAGAVLDEAHNSSLDESMALEKYQLAFLHDDEGAMSQIAGEAAGKSGIEDAMLASESDTEAFYGRLKHARDYSRRAVESASRDDAKDVAAGWEADSAIREAELGNPRESTHEAKIALTFASTKEVRIAVALALARAGQLASAESLANKLAQQFPEDTLLIHYWLPSVHAAMALQTGHFDQAITDLEASRPFELSAFAPFSSGALMYPTYLRGEAFLAARKYDQAANEFHNICDHRGLVWNSIPASLAWLELGRAYAGDGETQNAKAAYQKFLALWRNADSNSPTLHRARTEYAKL